MKDTCWTLGVAGDSSLCTVWRAVRPAKATAGPVCCVSPTVAREGTWLAGFDDLEKPRNPNPPWQDSVHFTHFKSGLMALMILKGHQ